DNDIKYGLNVVGIVNQFLRPIFKKDKKSERVEAMGEEAEHDLSAIYSAKFLNENFNIPLERVDEFIAYVEAGGVDYSLLKAGKELQFLEFINKKSIAFLNEEGGE